jgi:serine/threonine protein phosphatase PrpC
MVSGKKLICANVGDSRAIMGSLKHKSSQLTAQEVVASNNTHDPNKVWVAHALSRDHKPDTKDEKERILSSNGRVDTFREPNGDPIGPARVWLKNENIPGLAMSRSIGDLVAASVGVSSEPGKSNTALINVFYRDL